MKLTTLTLLFPVLLHASSLERAEQFFLCHYEAAQQLYFCHGIPTELSLSVWALESKYGSSHAATKHNNLGGIKSYEGGKKHNKHFATLDDFYHAFAAIFQQPCYKDMQPQTTGEYLEAMEWACCSYHRSKEYSRKINWIIKKFKLNEMIPTVPEPEEFYQEMRVYEDCYFKCGNKAKDWHWRTNQPICLNCAKTRKVSEIEKCTPDYKPPTKEEYLKDL